MGSVLGALLALSLIFMNQNVFQLITTSASPATDMTLFVSFFPFCGGNRRNYFGLHFYRY
jgi:hypothetical protein